MSIMIVVGLTIMLLSFLLAGHNFYHIADSSPDKVWKRHICSMVVMVIGTFVALVAGIILILNRLGV